MSAKFCVTARNRLTGVREIVTPPCSREKAESAKLKLCSSRGSRRPLTYQKVEPYNPQLELFK